MKKVISVILLIFTVLFLLASCKNENSEAINEAKAAWSKITNANELKNIPGYVEGWFYDTDDGVFKYHVGEKSTVVTADGSKFEVKAYDGSNANRYEIKDSGEGESVVFPNPAE